MIPKTCMATWISFWHAPLSHGMMPNPTLALSILHPHAPSTIRRATVTAGMPPDRIIVGVDMGLTYTGELDMQPDKHYGGVGPWTIIYPKGTVALLVLSISHRCRILRNGLVHTSYHQQMAGNQRNQEQSPNRRWISCWYQSLHFMGIWMSATR